MISLESRGMLARWFVWSCDHLPFTTGEYAEEVEGRKVARNRTGSYYIDRGTTLCHIFWAILWVPLIVTALISLFACIFVFMHLQAHNGFVLGNPESGAILRGASYFIPEAIMAVIVVAVGCIILACIGVSKVGFFQLLWQYLKGFKQRICPLVRFGAVS